MHTTKAKKPAQKSLSKTSSKQKPTLHTKSKVRLSVKVRAKQQPKLSFANINGYTPTSNATINHFQTMRQPQMTVSNRLITPFTRQRNTLRQFSTTTTNDSQAPPINKSLLQKLGLSSAADITLRPEQHKTFNRNLMIPAALLTHLSLGSVFAWSLFNAPLQLSNGVITAAATDWSLSSVMPVFSTTMSTFGTLSFLGGRLGLNEKYGPRVTTLLGAALFGGGFVVSSLAAASHTLPLLYLGYGLMAGSAVGIAYVGPVATLMKWFPDRRGLASSLGIVGFGAAGIFAAQFIERFLGLFRKLPQRIGDATQYPTQMIDGKLMATINGVQQEVVIATQASLKKLGKVGETLQEGMYLVGSGDTGISNTFLALGALYTIAIGMAAFMFRLPNERYDPTQPDNIRPLVTATTTDTATSATTTEKKEIVVAKPKFDYIATAGDLKPGNVLKTKQFWLLWTGLLCNSAAAYAIIGSAKNLMLDVYGVQYPLLVTSAFAATFVSMISAFNLSGRLGWGAISDKIGRKRTFDLLWGLSIPFYLGIPFGASLLEQGVDMQSSLAPMAVFYGSVCCAIACFGGSAAISPAYLVDLYGPKYSAANAGQLLSYLMVSGYLGPLTFTTLHKMATKQAIEDLTNKVDIGTFVAKFGATPDRLGELIDNKTISIELLMEIVPHGTPDPTPSLFNTVFITLASLQFIALICNQGITKIPDQKFLDQKLDDEKLATGAATIATKSPEAAQVLHNQQQSQVQREAELLQKVSKDTITEAPPLMNEADTKVLTDVIQQTGQKIQDNKQVKK